jgi:NDP-sugar pyrophosphorylase family protein
MKAVILAGGKGTRLRPYTTVIPKPLVPIGEKAIIEILLNQLYKNNVDEVFVCVNHFAELIKAFLGDGKKYGIKINYSLESSELGTVAPLKLLNNLPEDFLVMNGDLLTDLDFGELFKYHIEHKSNLTIATYSRDSKIDFGVIKSNPNNSCVVEFIEKPVYKFEVSMGVYVMNQSLLKLIPSNIHFGFDDLIHYLLKNNLPIKTFLYDGYWLDIGRPDDYEKANLDVEKINFLN